MISPWWWLLLIPVLVVLYVGWVWKDVYRIARQHLAYVDAIAPSYSARVVSYISASWGRSFGFEACHIDDARVIVRVNVKLSLIRKGWFIDIESTTSWNYYWPGDEREDMQRRLRERIATAKSNMKIVDDVCYKYRALFDILQFVYDQTQARTPVRHRHDLCC